MLDPAGTPPLLRSDQQPPGPSLVVRRQLGRTFERLCLGGEPAGDPRLLCGRFECLGNRLVRPLGCAGEVPGSPHAFGRRREGLMRLTPLGRRRSGVDRRLHERMAELEPAGTACDETAGFQRVHDLWRDVEAGDQSGIRLSCRCQHEQRPPCVGPELGRTRGECALHQRPRFRRSGKRLVAAPLIFRQHERQLDEPERIPRACIQQPLGRLRRQGSRRGALEQRSCRARRRARRAGVAGMTSRLRAATAPRHEHPRGERRARAPAAGRRSTAPPATPRPPSVRRRRSRRPRPPRRRSRAARGLPLRRKTSSPRAEGRGRARLAGAGLDRTRARRDRPEAARAVPGASRRRRCSRPRRPSRAAPANLDRPRRPWPAATSSRSPARPPRQPSSHGRPTRSGRRRRARRAHDRGRGAPSDHRSDADESRVPDAPLTGPRASYDHAL